MIATGQSLAIQFCHHGFVGEVQRLEEIGDGGFAFECVCPAVEDNLHLEGGEDQAGAGARISRSQSFQTGSKPSLRS